MYPHQRDTPGPHFTAPSAPVQHGAAAAVAIHAAVARTEQALHAGQLPRSKQTLFSIARDVAWTTNTDQDELLAALSERFSEFK